MSRATDVEKSVRLNRARVLLADQLADLRPRPSNAECPPGDTPGP